MQSSPPTSLVELFRQSGSAHHQAFLATNGDDPEWPIWYADWLYPQLTPFLATMPTKSELVYWLVLLDRLYRAAQPGVGWPEYYSSVLLDRFGAGAAG